MERGKLELLKQVAVGIAAQFGRDCEVVVHDLRKDPEHTIVFIVNGHISGRSVGDGASNAVLEQIRSHAPGDRDHLCCVIKTPDGKILKSSAVYIRNDQGLVSAVLTINYDISRLLMAEGALHSLASTEGPPPEPQERSIHVNDLLEDLLQRSVELVGKPVALMNKEDKVKAIRFLNQNGAFLVMKSGDKVSKYFGISKYTLYSYMDAKAQMDA